MQYNRFLILFTPLFVFILTEVFYFQPKTIFVVIVINILLLFFTLRQFILAVKEQEKMFNLLVLPVCFYVSTVFFCVFSSSRLLVQSLIFLLALFTYFYLRIMYYYLNKDVRFHGVYLENLASYGNFIVFYFGASVMYGLRVFLNISTWGLVLGLGVIAFLTLFNIFWANNIEFKKGFFYLILFVLIMIEIGWAASFLTLSYYILGLILVICYYVFAGLTRFYVLGRLDRKRVRIYISVGLFVILAVLFTSRWI